MPRKKIAKKALSFATRAKRAGATAKKKVRRAGGTASNYALLKREQYRGGVKKAAKKATRHVKKHRVGYAVGAGATGVGYGAGSRNRRKRY